MRRKSTAGRFAERLLIGVDDAGAEERVVIWIERKPGALWAVGRFTAVAAAPSPFTASTIASPILANAY